MTTPEPTDADVQLETYIRQQCLRHGTYSTEDVRARLAAHRIAAAKAERELCVAILRQTVESQTQMATNHIVSADFRKAYTYAASVLDSLLDQLTKGPTR